jgi:hypothetical protein
VTNPARRPVDSATGFFELRRFPPETSELIRSVLGLLQLTLYALRPLLSDESPQTRGRAGLAVAALREVLYDLRALSGVLGSDRGIAIKDK